MPFAITDLIPVPHASLSPITMAGRTLIVYPCQRELFLKRTITATVVVALIAAKAAWASIKSDCMGHLNSTPWRSRQDLHLRDTVLQTAA